MTTAVIEDSTIAGNSANGAAIFVANGSLVLANSTVSNNIEAGISATPNVSLLLENSTISNNSRGGISVGSTVGGTPGPGGMTVRNCTITGNTAANGAGVSLSNVNGIVLVQNSTITGNTATATNTTGGSGGGGIAATSSTAGYSTNLVLQSTIVAGNAQTSSTVNRPDMSAGSNVSVTADHCLIGVADTVTLAAGSANNLTGTSTSPLNPLLAPLGNYGGPTQTMPPMAGSPTLNAGSNPASLTADQRGQPRTVGTAPDIGAYEYVPITVANVQVNDGSAQRSEVRSITVTFSGPVSFAGGNAAAALQLQHVQTGDNVNLAAAVSTNAAGQTVVTLTFLATTVNGVDDTDAVSGSNGGCRWPTVGISSSSTARR